MCPSLSQDRRIHSAAGGRNFAIRRQVRRLGPVLGLIPCRKRGRTYAPRLQPGGSSRTVHRKRDGSGCKNIGPRFWDGICKDLILPSRKAAGPQLVSAPSTLPLALEVAPRGPPRSESE